MTKLSNIFKNAQIILAEGAIVERLKSEFKIPADPFINYGGAIYSHPETIGKLYKQYIEIGKRHGLPMMLMTSTRRSHEETINKSEFRNQSVIADNCQFLNGICESYSEYSKKILIGGIMGCKGDAYSTHEALSEQDAYQYHRKQSHQFINQPVDFLFAAIMPEIHEAIGMARAMSETEIPYIISFMIRKDGCLLDGTAIADAIKLIDEQVKPKPYAYMTNCVHPTNLKIALSQEINKNRVELKRFVGVQANASVLSPEELDNSAELHQSDFHEMSKEMIDLHHDFGIRVLGGCCGTNDKFIEILANSMGR